MQALFLLLGGGLAYYLFSGSKSEKTLSIAPYCQETLKKWLAGMSDSQRAVIQNAMSSNEGLEMVASELDKNGKPEVAACVRALKK